MSRGILLFRPPEVYGAARDVDWGGIRLPQSIGVCVLRQRGGGQERDGDPSVSVGDAGIDASLLYVKIFHLREF